MRFLKQNVLMEVNTIAAVTLRGECFTVTITVTAGPHSNLEFLCSLCDLMFLETSILLAVVGNLDFMKNYLAHHYDPNKNNYQCLSFT